MDDTESARQEFDWLMPSEFHERTVVLALPRTQQRDSIVDILRSLGVDDSTARTEVALILAFPAGMTRVHETHDNTVEGFDRALGRVSKGMP